MLQSVVIFFCFVFINDYLSLCSNMISKASSLIKNCTQYQNFHSAISARISPAVTSSIFNFHITDKLSINSWNHKIFFSCCKNNSHPFNTFPGIIERS